MVFVTGGTGLLGTHVLLELLSRGKDVRALKRSSSDLEQVQSVFKFYLKDRADEEFKKISWVEGDLMDITTLQEGIQGCEEVYHCAALVSFKKRDFQKMWQINKIGTANVVNVCLGENVRHLCYISSTAAIGKDPHAEFQTEGHKWKKEKKTSNYSITKYSAEMEVWRGIEEGLKAVILNPCVILGPGNWNESSISIFKVVKKGLKFYTPGMNAFVDARDVATIAAELTERGITGERYLIVAENKYFKEVFEIIASAFGVKAPSIEVKPWMASLAWRIEGILRVLFGRKQNITKETANSAMSITKFSNEKILDELNFQFIPIKDAVDNAVRYFESTYMKN
ncbi:MAG: NAD-dependent epimerase/dehydratase family protein [Crocinitomicaceae bacterium]|nr:NAD-dependent epimerase/dehydratase family protein [Crocinitomicaceae bacterium]